MTRAGNQTMSHGSEPRPSLLPFDPADLMAMRVLPAEFSRMVGVSKQTVSRWIHNGTVTLGPDGRVDPYKASREVIRNTDPARLRARVFKHAVSSHAELQARVVELEAMQADSARREQAIRWEERDKAAAAQFRFTVALVARFDEAVTAREAGTLDAWLDELEAVEVYGFTLEAYLADCAADVVPCPPETG